jgi:hypothetical protein
MQRQKLWVSVILKVPSITRPAVQVGACKEPLPNDLQNSAQWSRPDSDVLATSDINPIPERIKLKPQSLLFSGSFQVRDLVGKSRVIVSGFN